MFSVTSLTSSSTWLPKLAQSDARFDLGGDPLIYLLALNLGAVAVSAGTAWGATRFGAIQVAMVAALVGSLSLAVLSTFPSSIMVVYALLILAEAGSHGTIPHHLGRRRPLPRKTACGRRNVSDHNVAARSPK